MQSTAHGIPRHEMWRQRYRMRPYLKDVEIADLIARFQDIMMNLSTISAEGKIGPIIDHPNMPYWTETFTHVLEEFGRRGGLPHNLMENAQLPCITHPEPPDGYKILRGKPAPQPPCALKFGKKEHMEEMYKKGRILLRPASHYNDPSLNTAIRDDELSIRYIALKDETQASFIDKKTGQKTSLPLLKNAQVQQKSKTNYYIYCTCVRYDYRLLQDFDYDAMIHIRNGDEFRDRLNKAVEEKIGTTYEALDAPVKYFDPYRCKPNELSTFLSKDFRYAYQSEYRFIWLPENDINWLEPIYIELGSLEDIADLYFIE